MKTIKMMKAVCAAAMAGCMAFAMIGCSASSTSESKANAYSTVDGVTTGSNEVKTDDKGSASFKIDGNHVEMTNFAFDADSSLKVQAEIEEEDMVYTQVSVHDGEKVIQNIADGKYHETFTKDNVAKEFNTIYQTVLGADDAPVGDENVTEDEGVYVVQMGLSDGDAVLLAKADSDEFVLIAFTTTEYGTQEIIDAAFDSLKD